MKRCIWILFCFSALDIKEYKGTLSIGAQQLPNKKRGTVNESKNGCIHKNIIISQP